MVLSTETGMVKSEVYQTFFMFLVTEPAQLVKRFNWMIKKFPNFVNWCSKTAGCGEEQTLQKYELVPINSSGFKYFSIDFWTESDTGSCKMVKGSSFTLLSRHVLHDILFFRLIFVKLEAIGDSAQSSSRTQERISQASCCWNKSKSGFPDFARTCFKNLRNCDGSTGVLEDVSNVIIFTKDETNGLKLVERFERVVQNSGITFKH